MRLVRRLLASGGIAPLLVVSLAEAQPEPAPAPVAEPAPAAEPDPSAASSAPETLETPYQDMPAAAPPGPAPVPAAPDAKIALKPQEPLPDTRPELPVRAQRRIALLGEVGWNGLAGFGAIVAYHATPHVSLDIGGGFSTLGWKGGVRGRYNFSTETFSPFVGLGFNATSGLGQVTSDPKQDPDPEPGAQPFTIEVKPSFLAQAVIGFEVVRRQGFTMQAALGYARLLNKDNVRLIDGTLTPDEKTAIDVFFKSGPVVSMAFGTSFK